MKNFAVIKVDGSMQIHDVSELDEYEFLSGVVGGYIQSVFLDNEMREISLWCNEEGKLVGLPLNAVATAIWEESYGATDIIVGDVVLTGLADDEGDTLGLSDDDVAKLSRICQFA
jgi:hypothetical protein